MPLRLRIFAEKNGAVSDEQGERFHDDIKTIQMIYEGIWDSSVMGDYRLFVKIDDLTLHKGKNQLNLIRP